MYVVFGASVGSGIATYGPEYCGGDVENGLGKGDGALVGAPSGTAPAADVTAIIIAPFWPGSSAPVSMSIPTSRDTLVLPFGGELSQAGNGVGTAGGGPHEGDAVGSLEPVPPPHAASNVPMTSIAEISLCRIIFSAPCFQKNV